MFGGRAILFTLIILLAGCAAPVPGADVDPPPPPTPEVAVDDTPVPDDPPLLGSSGSVALEVDLYPLAHTRSTDPPVGPMSFAALGEERRGFAIRQSGKAEHILIMGDRSGAPYAPFVEGHGALEDTAHYPHWVSKDAYLLSWPGVTAGDVFLVDPYNQVRERECVRGEKSFYNLWGAMPEAYDCLPEKVAASTTIAAGTHNTRRWSPGYIRAAPFVATSPHDEILFQKDDGSVLIEKMERVTSVQRYREKWSTDWDTFVPYVLDGKLHVLSYSSTTGKAALDRFVPATGAALTLTSVWTDAWQPGWKGFAVLSVDDRRGLDYVACRPAASECVLDRIAPDGALSTLARTTVGFTTDDVKTLGAMPYTGDGTASLVVRNGGLWTELVFSTDQARIEAVRTPRALPPADFDLSGDGMRVAGKLLARPAAGGPPVGPMSWVARGDTVVGRSPSDALAQQVVVVPREGSTGGPPSAFKFPTLWGERYGGARSHYDQIVTARAGTYDLLVDPYFPVVAYSNLDSAAAYGELFVDSMEEFVRIFEDPHGSSPPDFELKTRVVFRDAQGRMNDLLHEPGFVRAAPIDVVNLGDSAHFLLLQKADGTTLVMRLLPGADGKVMSWSQVYRGNWAHSWDVYRVFWANGQPYLFSYATSNGAAAVDKLNFATDFSSLGFEPVWKTTWDKNWQGFAPMLVQGQADVAFTYAACNFDRHECVIDQIDQDLELKTIHKVDVRGKMAPLASLGPGFRSEINAAHLIGWRGGTGWIDVRVALA